MTSFKPWILESPRSNGAARLGLFRVRVLVDLCQDSVRIFQTMRPTDAVSSTQEYFSRVATTVVSILPIISII
jgi:hypothetical protein